MRYAVQRKTYLILTALLILAMATTACASRGGPIKTAQDGAQVIAESVLLIDQEERALFRQGLVDQALHDRLGRTVISLLYAARGYERAVAAEPTARAGILAAGAAVLTALEDFEQGLPPAVRPGLAQAINAIRAAVKQGGTT